MARNQKERGGRNDRDRQESEFEDKLVFINRVAKVVKGGRRFSFSALVVSGDHDGNVGYGFGKANEVAECIRKANEIAKRSLQKVSLTETSTIPHEPYADVTATPAASLGQVREVLLILAPQQETDVDD